MNDTTPTKCPECNGQNRREEYLPATYISDVGQHVICPNCKAELRVTALIEVG